MLEVRVDLCNLPGTEAALGRAGAHTLVVDRPEGRAGGRGLGFNGAELLALTVGGCFCNDLRYVAHDRGLRLGAIAVTVTVTLGGEPILATAVRLEVAIETLGGGDPSALVEAAAAISMAANSLRRGVPVEIAAAPASG